MSRPAPFTKKGGITVSGGEPLMQIGFVTELFEKAKKSGIHTCLDTSGITFNLGSQAVMAHFERLLASTDLILLDIKHIDPKEHVKLCAQPQDNILLRRIPGKEADTRMDPSRGGAGHNGPGRNICTALDAIWHA